MPRWDLHLVSEPRGGGIERAPLTKPVVAMQRLPYLAVRRRQPSPVDSIHAFPDYPQSFLTMLYGIDLACLHDSDVLLMALGLPGQAYSDDDPLFVELRGCVERGMQVVVAAGNFGPGKGTLSALAHVPGVVSVAASDLFGAEVLNRSSRGNTDGLHPTITSSGDNRVVVVGGRVFEPGTSFAAGRVAGMCGFLRCMVRWMGECVDRSSDDEAPSLPMRALLTQLDTETSPTGLEDLGLSRSVGAELSDPARCREWIFRVSDHLGDIGVECTLSWTPSAIARILRRMSVAMPGVEPANCGAGFVDENVMRRRLLGLDPSAYVALFGDGNDMTTAQKVSVDELGRALGCLWSWDDYSIWQSYYRNSLVYVAVTHGGD